MKKYQTDDLRIKDIKQVASPAEIHTEFPVSEKAATLTQQTRGEIKSILQQLDDRLMVVIGPCSIHDPKAALEYAQRLYLQKQKWSDQLLIIMRVYFEKPRTIVGWKGLINDPDLDGSFHINKGLKLARQLLLDINESGVPAGTEFLDLITPQYVADLIGWGAIGARTTESQVHRELASGLSCPVGFKNGTDGGLQIAIDAIRSASQPHIFLSMTKQGQSAIFSTTGNKDCHIILRGGKTPNYDAANVALACRQLNQAGVTPQVMIDFSHANSEKSYPKQLRVAENVGAQIAAGDRHIIGAMIESHLVAGRQNIENGKSLVYGQSITDACVGWPETEKLLEALALAVTTRRHNHQSIPTETNT